MQSTSQSFLDRKKIMIPVEIEICANGKEVE